MRWNIKQTIKNQNPEQRQTEIITSLLKNRNIENHETFFSPPHPSNIPLKQIGLDEEQVGKAVQRIKQAIQNQEQIIVYGDYDADGITATAIMWETLHQLAKVKLSRELNLNPHLILPHIPDRFSEGYGMKIDVIRKLKTENQKLNLIITVDQGITSHEAIEYCNQQGIDVIITDHHQLDKRLPSAHAIVHTTQTSGSGVAWWFCQKLKNELLRNNKNSKIQKFENLDLATIGTIADLLPLTGINRSLVYHGLTELGNTIRPGLKELFQTAAVKTSEIQSWHVGYLIAPRINAMGRIEHALDSLRLLCTPDTYRAKQLAHRLYNINQKRQQLTQQMAERAIGQAQSQSKQNIIIIGHQDYPEGIIGLIAGKLVEKFYKPTIVFSYHKIQSKASARSVSNYDIIAAIRTAQKFLISAGGHPMAAGLTIATDKLDDFTRQMIKHAQQNLTKGDLIKTLQIDTQIKLADITSELYQQIIKLEPFGVGNFEPTFITRRVQLQSVKKIGTQQQHLKLTLKDQNINFSAIAFNQAHHLSDLKTTKTLDIAYTISKNTWQGKISLELKIKDIKPTSTNFKP
jgi:single-stranded-DNA-specific exonuclease